MKSFSSLSISAISLWILAFSRLSKLYFEELWDDVRDGSIDEDYSMMAMSGDEDDDDYYKFEDEDNDCYKLEDEDDCSWESDEDDDSSDEDEYSSSTTLGTTLF